MGKPHLRCNGLNASCSRGYVSLGALLDPVSFASPRLLLLPASLLRLSSPRRPLDPLRFFSDSILSNFSLSFPRSCFVVVISSRIIREPSTFDSTWETRRGEAGGEEVFRKKILGEKKIESNREYILVVSSVYLISVVGRATDNAFRFEFRVVKNIFSIVFGQIFERLGEDGMCWKRYMIRMPLLRV